MPNYKYIALLILIINNFTISAQHHVELSFKNKPFEKFSLVIHKASDVDTLYIGQLDISGYSLILIMDTVSPTIATLVFEDKQQLDLVLNKENFKVENCDEKINILNTKYINSEENTYLLNYLSGIRNPIDSSLYSSKLTRIIDFISADSSRISGIPLDWPSVYKSSLWNTVVNKWVNNYFNSKDYNLFIKDIIETVNGIQIAEVKLNFINTLLQICEFNQWPYIEYKLVEYFYLQPEEIGTKGKLLEEMRKIGILIGDRIPDFIFDNGIHLNDIQSNKILIFFFDSACDNCQKELQKLILNYQKIESRDIAIITVSVDQNKLVCGTDNKLFPWNNHKSDIFGDVATKLGVFFVPSFLFIEQGILTKRGRNIEEFMPII